MNGVNGQPESYELMSHCESGWGTVPRVLFKEGQEVTLTRYLSWPPQPISAPTIEARASRAGMSGSRETPVTSLLGNSRGLSADSAGRRLPEQC